MKTKVVTKWLVTWWIDGRKFLRTFGGERQALSYQKEVADMNGCHGVTVRAIQERKFTL